MMHHAPPDLIDKEWLIPADHVIYTVWITPGDHNDITLTEVL